MKPFLRCSNEKSALSALAISAFQGQQPERYYEPFVGCGISICQLRKTRFFDNLETIVISDPDPVIVEAYRIVRDQLWMLIPELQKLSRKHNKNPEKTFEEIKTAFKAREQPHLVFFKDSVHYFYLQSLIRRKDGKIDFVWDKDNLIKWHEFLNHFADICFIDFANIEYWKNFSNVVVYLDPPRFKDYFPSARQKRILSKWSLKDQQKLRNLLNTFVEDRVYSYTRQLTSPNGLEFFDSFPYAHLRKETPRINEFLVYTQL